MKKILIQYAGCALAVALMSRWRGRSEVVRQ